MTLENPSYYDGKPGMHKSSKNFVHLNLYLYDQECKNQSCKCKLCYVNYNLVSIFSSEDS